MARTRQIKPSFFTNEVLGTVSPLGRLLFISLWGLADRNGLLEHRPERLKATVLPYDDCDINSLLQELNGKFITIYGPGGKYIKIHNFSKHQHIFKDEPASNIPPPIQKKTLTEQIETRGTSPLSSIFSLQASKRIPQQAVNRPTAPQKPSQKPMQMSLLGPVQPEEFKGHIPSNPNYSPQFKRFWAMYPKKCGGFETYRAWKAMGLDSKVEEVLKGLKNSLDNNPDWKRKFIKDPVRWIKGGCWLDEFEGQSSGVPDYILAERQRRAKLKAQGGQQ